MNQDIKKIEVCSILGVNIATCDMNHFTEFINKNIYKLTNNYICVSNVYTTVFSYDNKIYQDIQNGGLAALPDGKPLSVLAKLKGYSNTDRITGPDLMEEMFKVSVKYNYRHYFYGSTNETLNMLKNKLLTRYPGIQIAGMYSPPFRKTGLVESDEIIDKINDSNPHFIWVGLGAPKQEYWMHEHKGKIKGLMIGVGAGFDYHAGNLKRAPNWMQKCSLEWFYRFMQEPNRLFKRYVKSNFKFLWLIIRGK